MFTGIVTMIGEVTTASDIEKGRLRIACDLPAEDRQIGASISHSGCCLTLTHDHGAAGYDVQVSPTTRAITTLGHWQVGRRMNIEPALRIGDSLGGHLVQGHVDTVGQLDHRDDDRFWFSIDREHASMVIERGSITIDGVSLTINEIKDTPDACVFGVTIVPHTASVTTLADLRSGELVNIEFDVIGRYLQRWHELTKIEKGLGT
ncbi:MAG: riboflavin synthase [Pseudomonadota bacterium]